MNVRDMQVNGQPDGLPGSLKESEMNALNVITLILLVVGGLNWGLVGLFDFDLVAALFGAGSFLSRLVYILVAVSAIWQLIQFFSASSRVTRHA